MRKRVQTALAVLLVGLVGVIAWQVWCAQEREPVYQGKRLSVWLREYHWGMNTNMAASAVRQIGTNAIPILLRMLCEKDSSPVSKLVDLWDRRLLWNPHLPRWVRLPAWYKNQAAFLNDEAEEGFEILGADAQQAVPALIGLYEQNISPSSQVSTSRALNAIGPAAQRMAIPSFLRAAASSNAHVREVAVWALFGVHTEPQLVVPGLVKALSDTNSVIRIVAAKGLAGFGTNAQQAVPALELLLSDPDRRLVFAAANALKQIDPEAAAKAGVK